MTGGDRRGASFFRAAFPGRPCPDCLAVADLAEHSPGVYVVAIQHDLSCPTYQRILARRARGAS